MAHKNQKGDITARYHEAALPVQTAILALLEFGEEEVDPLAYKEDSYQVDLPFVVLRSLLPREIGT